MGAKEKLLKRQVLEGFMCDALKYHKLNDARQDLELAIRQLRAACKENGVKFASELMDMTFRATDGEVCIDEVVEEHD